jgi:hypothetical protein
MNIVAIIGAVLQIFLIWIKTKTEKDEVLRKKKEVVLKEANDALEARDPSAVNAAINKLNRL